MGPRARNVGGNPFANLLAWVTFWVDQGSNEACCQSADDETLEGDPDQFDCQQCPLMDAYDDLRPENKEAWALYKQLCTRFTHEFHIAPVLMQKAVAELDFDEAATLAQRLTVIYDTLYPPKPEKA